MTQDNPTIVMTTDPVGGIWTYAVDLGRDLTRKGMVVKLAVVGAPVDANRRASATAAGLQVFDIGHATERFAQNAGEVAAAGDALAALSRREGANLLHLNHPALAAQSTFDVPILGACHSCLATWWEAVKGTPLPDTYRWRTDLVARGYRAAKALVAPSRAFAEATQRVYGLADLPEVVHHGRAPDTVATPDTSPAEAVFTAGRLWDEAKNARTLDRVAALTTAPFRAAGSVKAPDGTAVELTHLELLGALTEEAMRLRLAEQPVYVTAALFEPFGLAILEAAQAGCALVLSDIDSFRELWTDAALFVPATDEEAFAAAVGRLLSDPEMRADYAHAAQNRARAFGLEAFVDDTTNLYKTLLASAPRGAT